MTKLTKNLDIFFQSYDLTKSNYNIIIHSPNGTGKYDFVISLIGEYYKNNKIPLSDDILTSPDILYISLPLFDKSSKIIRVYKVKVQASSSEISIVKKCVVMK